MTAVDHGGAEVAARESAVHGAQSYKRASATIAPNSTAR